MFIWLTDDGADAGRWNRAAILRGAFTTLIHSVYWSKKLSFFQAMTELHLAPAHGQEYLCCVLSDHTCLCLPALLLWHDVYLNRSLRMLWIRRHYQKNF